MGCLKNLVVHRYIYYHSCIQSFTYNKHTAIHTQYIHFNSYIYNINHICILIKPYWLSFMHTFICIHASYLYTCKNMMSFIYTHSHSYTCYCKHRNTPSFIYILLFRHKHFYLYTNIYTHSSMYTYIYKITFIHNKLRDESQRWHTTKCWQTSWLISNV